MAYAFVLFGQHVKQSTNISYTFNIKSGFVSTLLLNGIKYTHTETKNYTDDEFGRVTAGYYQEVQFFKYLARTISADDLKAFKLPLDQLPDAVKGDSIVVNKLRVAAPYDDFCTTNQYVWPFDPDAVLFDAAGNIIIPTSAPSNPIPVSLNPEQPAVDFYRKNIALVKSNDYPDDKDAGAYTVAISALEIHRINRDIFPLFSQSPDLVTYINAQNTYWASGVIFNKPNHADLLQYEQSLTNYYIGAYSNQLFIEAQTTDNKLIWLLSVLSPSGLGSLPIDLKLSLISQMVDILVTDGYDIYGVTGVEDIAPLAPGVILNLVASVENIPSQTDYFLSQLLETKYAGILSSDQTLFEAIYDRLGDNYVGVLTLGVFNTKNNKKQFIKSLYNIWKSSKFYPYYYSPDYTQQPDSRSGVYRESFFVANKNLYYDPSTAPAILAYNSSGTTLTSYRESFKFALDSHKVVASKVTVEAIKDEHHSSETITTTYGTYHLFQPVTLVGYAQNSFVHVPNTGCIPVFYLLYTYEAKEIHDFEIGILNIIELAINLFLNATLIGALADASYLAEISELAEAATLPEATPILTWNNFMNLNRIVTFTAGNFQAITDYMVNQDLNDDLDVKEAIKRLNNFLSYVMLGSLGVDVINHIGTAIAADAAESIIVDLNQENAVPQEAWEGVVAFVPPDAIELMKSKLQRLELLAENTILAKFQGLTPGQQMEFIADFDKFEDSHVIWNKLNEVYDTSLGRTLVDDWKEVEYLKSHRKDIEFLENVKFINSDEELNMHIFNGHLNPREGTLNVKPEQTFAANGHPNVIKYQVVGVHTLKPPIPEDIMVVSKGEENTLGYYKAFIKKKPGNGWVNPSDSNPLTREWSITKKTTCFPDEYTRKRIQEEMALGFKNKTPPNGVLQTSGNYKFTGIMTDGEEIVFLVRPDGVIDYAYPNVHLK